MTQCELVLKYIDDFGSITPIEAMADLGIMRLASRISDLKKAGYPIHKETAKGISRYGKPTHFARYSMEVMDGR